MQRELETFRTREILEKIKRLNHQQKTEVVHFIDFLNERKSEGLPLMQLLNATATPGIELQDVRKRLAKISGKMSETVRSLRDERG